MGELKFVLKTFIITVVAILFMQIQWGNVTIEEYTMEFLTSASIVKPIDQTASGMVIFVRNMWTKMTRSLNTGFSHALSEENRPGSRHSILNVDRSKAYLSNKAHEAREIAAGLEDKFEGKNKPTAENEKGIFEKLRDKTVEAKNRVRSKFIDETEVPGKTASPPAASSGRGSSDDESEELIEDNKE